jgi:uncharacterized protein
VSAEDGEQQYPKSWRSVCRQQAATQASRDAHAAWLSAGVNGSTPFDHRWEHVQAVVRLARWLAAELNADLEVAEASAWLHDIRKGEPDHGAAGAEAAAEILAHTDFPAEKIGVVVDAIRQHVGLSRPEGAPALQPLEAAILWDADKLSKIGIRGLALNLCAHYGAGTGLTERRLANEEYVREVLAKTVDSMNTAPARRLAKERYATMVAALTDWEREDELEEL